MWSAFTSLLRIHSLPQNLKAWLLLLLLLLCTNLLLNNSCRSMLNGNYFKLYVCCIALGFGKKHMEPGCCDGIGRNCIPHIIYAIGFGRSTKKYFQTARKSLVIKLVSVYLHRVQQSFFSSSIGKQDSLVALASIIGDSVIFVPYPSNGCFVLNLESQLLQFKEFILGCFRSSSTYFSSEFVFVQLQNIFQWIILPCLWILELCKCDMVL